MSAGIIDVLQFAIDATTSDTNASANNIANANTPGYHAAHVEFQASLDAALNSPANTATATLTETPDVPGAQGNDVSLSAELVNAEHDALQYQQLSESLTAQFRLIRGAAGGGYQ